MHYTENEWEDCTRPEDFSFSSDLTGYVINSKSFFHHTYDL